jgi:deoxycytidine triphosphate deaminase
LILTGPEIAKECRCGNIIIEPFIPENVNPNSYNFRLGEVLRVYDEFPLDPKIPNKYSEIYIPEEGYVLQPSQLYLGCTIEILGSTRYAPTYAARSSVARLGLFINLSASLGDIGFIGQWTLQLFTMHPLRVYAGMRIGQMMWWRPQGVIDLYHGKYQGSEGPQSTLIYKDFEKEEQQTMFKVLEGASVT